MLTFIVTSLLALLYLRLQIAGISDLTISITVNRESLKTTTQPQQLIAQLNFAPDANKTNYLAEIFRDPVTITITTANGTNITRSAGAATYYYLPEGSATTDLFFWHRIDAEEVWEHHAEVPVSLLLPRGDKYDGAPMSEGKTGQDGFDGEQQQGEAMNGGVSRKKRSWLDWVFVVIKGMLKLVVVWMVIWSFLGVVDQEFVVCKQPQHFELNLRGGGAFM